MMGFDRIKDIETGDTGTVGRRAIVSNLSSSPWAVRDRTTNTRIT